MYEIYGVTSTQKSIILIHTLNFVSLHSTDCKHVIIWLRPQISEFHELHQSLLKLIPPYVILKAVVVHHKSEIPEKNSDTKVIPCMCF